MVTKVTACLVDSLVLYFYFPVRLDMVIRDKDIRYVQDITNVPEDLGVEAPSFAGDKILLSSVVEYPFVHEVIGHLSF